MKTYCKQIPEYILEAAKGNMTSEKKDNSITSKMSLKLENQQALSSNQNHEKNGWKTGHPLGKRGERILRSQYRSNAKDGLKKRTRRSDKNAHRLQQRNTKGKFIPYKAEMDIVIANEVSKRREKISQ